MDRPVQAQMVVTVFKSPLGGECYGTKNMDGKHSVGRRRVFVQTETGCVLWMELDRCDNAHTVKRRLQLAFDVPTEESSLTFGGMVLNNDLDVVRNDSPLLLTRNYMHRSSSSPCLWPSCKDIQQKDQSDLIEILGQSNSSSKLKDLVEESIRAIKTGIDPLPVHSGLGGAYLFRNDRGESVAIVKPTNEEPFAPNNPKGFVGNALGQPGLKRSVRVGETGFREVAAYLLDYDHFANVPSTALVKITHSIFNVNDWVNSNRPRKKKQVTKIASFQQYIQHDFDASDHGTSRFPISAVHHIGILDVRIFNTDRHAGNLLVRKLGRFGQVELIPIDHGFCLPETLEDPYFEWIHWPQASIPFSGDELEYIEKLDPVKDCDMLRKELPMIREACLRVLVLCTIFLKEAVSAGLCLAEIGEMMTREFRAGEEEPSDLEIVCIKAKKLIPEREVLSPGTDSGDEEFQFDVDFDENEKEEDGVGKFGVVPLPERLNTRSVLSESLQNISLGDKEHGCQKLSGFKTEYGQVSTSLGNRTADEHIPASTSFIELADMNNEEWRLFLQKFQELLLPAFNKRKYVTLNQRQRQRLGTSCQF